MTTLRNDIPSTKLAGHQAPVLCMDYDSSTSSLLSGSEDCTARLWDLRCSKATNCFVVQEEVTAVAFGPPRQALASETPTSKTIFLGVGATLFCYDLRKLSSPIIKLKEDPYAAEIIFEAEDEINQISIAEHRQKKGCPLQYLAAADDTGIVQVIDITSNSNEKSSIGKASIKHELIHCTERASIVTSAVFRPRSKNLVLASGGTDCQICLWDVNKPKKPMCTKKITTATSARKNQLCNPPMVHSLAWSPSGNLLAAGLGDGTASVYSIENRSFIELARLQEENDHDSPVASVFFPAFLPLPLSQHDVNAQDRLLASIRNDAVIKMWDLGCTVAGEAAVNASLSLSHYQQQPQSVEIEDDIDALSLVDKPKMLFAIPHHSKPNWMLCTAREDPIAPSSIFVSDITADISAYSIRLR